MVSDPIYSLFISKMTPLMIAASHCYRDIFEAIRLAPGTVVNLKDLSGNSADAILVKCAKAEENK